MTDFERVFTMTDYYDGPRAGIASFMGKPHTYASLFDEEKDQYSSVFELTPVDEETLLLALEEWEIWLRWDDAFHAGLTPLESHPALPEDRRRHAELAPLLAERLKGAAGSVIRARAEFRPVPGQEHTGRGRWLEARWDVVG